MFDFVSLRTWTFGNMMRMIKEPENHEKEIRPTYSRLRGELTRAFANLDWRFQNNRPEDNFCSPDANVFMAQAAGILSLHAMFNGILQVLEPENLWMLDFEFNEAFALQLKLSELAMPYRPLGSSHMLSCLIATRAVSRDPLQQAKAEQLLVEFGTGYVDWDHVGRSEWLRDQLRAMRGRLERKRAMEGETPTGSISEDVSGLTVPILIEDSPTGESLEDVYREDRKY